MGKRRPALWGSKRRGGRGKSTGSTPRRPLYIAQAASPPAIRAQAGLREGVCRPQAGVRLVWAHTGPRLLSITCDSRAVSRCQRAGAVDVSMARRLSGRTPGFLRAEAGETGLTVQGTCSTLRILRQVNSPPRAGATGRQSVSDGWKAAALGPRGGGTAVRCGLYTGWRGNHGGGGADKAGRQGMGGGSGGGRKAPARNGDTNRATGTACVGRYGHRTPAMGY